MKTAWNPVEQRGIEPLTSALRTRSGTAEFAPTWRLCTGWLYGTIAFVLAACGGTVEPGPGASDAAADVHADVATDADAGCWRCADRAWRNVCVVPAERAPDSESCLHCGEHCVSDPPDATSE